MTPTLPIAAEGDVIGFLDLHRLSSAGRSSTIPVCLSPTSSQMQTESDDQLIADCCALAAKRDVLFAEYANPVGDEAFGQSCSHAHIQQLVDEVIKYGRRVAATPAVTSVGLQSKRAIVGLILAELTDDPSPACDKLLMSLLSDLDRVCVHFASLPSTVGLQEHTDDQLIEACRLGFEQIQNICMEFGRVGALPPLQEQEQLTDFLVSLLMQTRKSLLDIAGMVATSYAGIQVKGYLLRRMMTIGEADVHYVRLALARSFVADIALLEPLIDAELRAVGGSPHWWTNLANRFLRMTGNASGP